MSQILASGRTAGDKYDNRATAIQKVLARLDVRQIATSFQRFYEVCKGFCFSGIEGASEALNALSVITPSNINNYANDITQGIQTLVANACRLEVEGSSTPNNIILRAPKITSDNAPDGGNYTKTTPLPFEFKDGLRFTFRATLTNTGAVQIFIQDFNGLTNSVDLIDESNNLLTGGEIILGRHYTLICATVANVKKLVLIGRGSGGSGGATLSKIGSVYLPKRISIENDTLGTNLKFGIGTFIFDDYSGQASLKSPLSKNFNRAWVLGNGGGGIGSGDIWNTLITTKWYAIYGIYNPSSDMADIISEQVGVTPVLPSGFTKKSDPIGYYTHKFYQITQGKWLSDGSFTYTGAPNTYLIEFISERRITWSDSSQFDNVTLGLIPPIPNTASLRLKSVISGAETISSFGRASLQAYQNPSYQEDPYAVSPIMTNPVYINNLDGNPPYSYENHYTVASGNIILDSNRVKLYHLQRASGGLTKSIVITEGYKPI